MMNIIKILAKYYQSKINILFKKNLKPWSTGLNSRQNNVSIIQINKCDMSHVLEQINTENSSYKI